VPVDPRTSGAPGTGQRAPVPVLALDVPTAADADRLLRAVPDADWVKVGLQLFTAEGPPLVRSLVEGGRRVFLDLKLHDIPNTVAGAVRSASGLGVELLTVHASGGRAMLEAAAAAASGTGTRLLAVTVLTSLHDEEVAEAWGRDRLDTGAEVHRLAGLAFASGVEGVVCAVHEAGGIRADHGPDPLVLTPGIRLRGGDVGDQRRVATPAAAVAAGSDFLVIGRAVTGSPDPAGAWAEVRRGIIASAVE
jgi:orotidine-5'-phosphate decarboxylase